MGPVGPIRPGGVLNWISLCNLCVLCVSVVVESRDTTTTESQRTQRLHRAVGQTKTSPTTYSYRRAINGSTFVARRAGSAHASTAAPSDTRSTIKYVAGSDALTPNNMLDIQRVSANAPANPITVPISVSNIPLRITISRIP